MRGRHVRAAQARPPPRVVPVREREVLPVREPPDLRERGLGREVRELRRRDLLREAARAAQGQRRVRPSAGVLEGGDVLEDLETGSDI